MFTHCILRHSICQRHPEVGIHMGLPQGDSLRAVDGPRKMGSPPEVGAVSRVLSELDGGHQFWDVKARSFRWTASSYDAVMTRAMTRAMGRRPSIRRFQQQDQSVSGRNDEGRDTTMLSLCRWMHRPRATVGYPPVADDRPSAGATVQPEQRLGSAKRSHTPSLSAQARPHPSADTRCAWWRPR